MRQRRCTEAAALIQALHRGHRGRVKAQARKLAMRKVQQDAAAMSIQAIFRGHRVREKMSQDAKHWSAVAKVQAAYRGHSLRKRLAMRDVLEIEKRRQSQQAATSAAVAIQAIYRGHIVRELVKEVSKMIALKNKARHQNLAALRIQAAYRGHIVRRTTLTPQCTAANPGDKQLHDAAIRIQSMYRRHSARKARARGAMLDVIDHDSEDQKYRAAVVVQEACRRHLATKNVLAKRCPQQSRNSSSTNAIQSADGRPRSRNSMSSTGTEVDFENELRRGRAAGVIQAVYRRRFARRQSTVTPGNKRWNRSAVVVQATYRRHRSKKSTGSATANADANEWRRDETAGAIERTVIQATDSNLQATIAMNELTTNAETQRRQRSATLIQLGYRGYRLRRFMAGHGDDHQKRPHRGVAVVQAACRGYLARRKLAVELCAREEEKNLVFIQSVYRRHSWRKSMSNEDAAGAYGRSERQRFRAATAIQAAYRGQVCRKKLVIHIRDQQLHRNVTNIQSKYRRHPSSNSMGGQGIRDQRQLHQAATVVQAAYRGSLARRKHSVDLCTRKEHRSAVIIQSTYRRHRLWKFTASGGTPALLESGNDNSVEPPCVSKQRVAII